MAGTMSGAASGGGSDPVNGGAAGQDGGGAVVTGSAVELGSVGASQGGQLMVLCSFST